MHKWFVVLILLTTTLACLEASSLCTGSFVKYAYGEVGQICRCEDNRNGICFNRLEKKGVLWKTCNIDDKYECRIKIEPRYKQIEL